MKIEEYTAVKTTDLEQLVKIANENTISGVSINTIPLSKVAEVIYDRGIINGYCDIKLSTEQEEKIKKDFLQSDIEI